MKAVSFFIVLITPFMVFSQSQLLTPEKLMQLNRISEHVQSADGKYVFYVQRKMSIELNKGNSDIYRYDMTSGENKAILNGPYNESTPQLIPGTRRIAFLSSADGSSQIYECNYDGSDIKQVTGIASGINEYGFANTGNRVWFTSDVKLDKQLKDFHSDLPKTEARLMDGLMYKHWNAWHDYAYSHIFIAEYSNGALSSRPIDIMNDTQFDSPLKPFGGAEQISFSPDGKKIAYTCKKLIGTSYALSTNSEIYLYDLENNSDIVVSAGMPGYDVNPVFSSDGNKLMWLSMETPGYEADRNRIFQYDFQTKNKAELTVGFDYSVDKAVYTNDGNGIYFLAGKEATHQLYYMSLNAKVKKGITQLTNVQADIQNFDVVQLSKKNTQIIISMMAIDAPTSLYKLDSKYAPVLIVNPNKTELAEIKFGKVEKRMVKTTDQKDMLTWVIYPPDFDPTKKYPTLLYCQGGPQSTVSQFFSYRWNFQMMAANGYIVVAPNRRGLPSFGEAWNDQITNDWGGQAMQDLLSAIDDVSNEKWCDKDRLGAVGASFGGYSVYWLAGNHKKRFKTFISHCGVFNLESMYGSTEELFFVNHDMKGPYWASDYKKNYEKFSPHTYIANWDTPLLVIHNELDFRVPLSQGMEAYTAAQLMGVPSKFLYFPDEGHWVNKPQNAILWQRVFFEWLDTYLK